MSTFDDARKLKALRLEKISLHESWKKCETNGDRVGMQRYKNKIKKIDRLILAIMDGE